MSLIRLQRTGQRTITGTMWLVLRRCGMPAASSRRRTWTTRSCCASRSAELALRWRMLAQAPAASAGGRAVVKMKPEAKLRTKSHKAAEAAM